MATVVKGKTFDGRQVFKTKNGQAFIKMASGKAKFIKNSSVGLKKANPPKKAKAKAKAKSSNPSNPSPKKRSRGGMKGIATAIGAVGTLLSGVDVYREQIAAGRSIGSSILFAMGGYDTNAGGVNTGDKLFSRNIRVYGPIAAGAIASKVATKTGLNRKLPKGINL